MAQAGADIYERFFHNLPTMMAAVDYNGLFINANSAWEAVLGRPAGSLAGTPCLDLVHPEDRERVALLKKTVIEGEPQVLFEARFLCRDGTHKWFHMRCAADREKRLIYTAASDITSRKAVETALHESRESLKLLLEQAPIAIGVRDGRGDLKLINRKFSEVFGYSAAEISSFSDWCRLAYPDPAVFAAAKARWEASLKASSDSPTGEIPPGEYAITCKDGTVKTVTLHGIVTAEKDLLVMFEDISAKAAAMKALRESEETLRRILDSAPMSMSIVSMDGTIEYINRKAVETFGFEHAEIPNMDRWWAQAYPDEAYRKEVIERWMGRVYAAWEKKGEIAGGEYLVTCKDGTKKTCDIFGVIAAGKVFVMFNDVTPRAEALRSLRENETTLRSILDQAPVAIAIQNFDNSIEFINLKFQETFGYCLQEMPTLERWARLAYPDKAYRKKLLAMQPKQIEGSVKTGKEMEPVEVQVACKDGSVKTVNITGVVTPDKKIVSLLEDVTARRKAQQALRESETTLRRILEQVPVSLAVHDTEGKVEFVNRRFTEDFGYRLEDIPTFARWAEQAYPDPEYRRELASTWDKWVEKSLRTGQQMEGREVRLRCRSGETRMVFITGMVTPDRKVIALLNDVTARSETERALRERESLYRALVETTQTGYVIMDGQGKVLDANREYVRLSGHSDLKEIMGRTVLEWSAPHSQKRAWEAVEIVVRDGRISNFELDYTDKAGKFTTIEINATVVSRGGAKQILGLCRDVSARSKTEAQLRESESLYRALVETTRTGYVVIDNTGKVVDANREYVRLTGHADLKEILGRKVTEWTAPDLAEKNAAAVAQCARDGHIFNFETDYIDKAGKRTPIEISATVVSRGSGPQIHTICRDITQRRRTEAELRLLNQGLEERVRERTAELSAANEDLMQEISQRVQAEKDKAKLGEELQQAQKMEAVGRLAGGIAHDFNNILVSISGYAEFLLKSLPEGAQGREDITEILFETEKGAALTRQLLTFSRKQPIKTEVLDLNEVVSETEKMLTRLVGANIRFEKRLAPVLDRITADPGQVSQVIMNLVLNARDAMPEGGRITLETRNAEIGAQYLEMRLAPKPGHYVLLSVSDTGSGMGHDTMHHIFEPFFTTKEEGKGTGLGLPTVYGIVSQARGGISVSSEPGKGTTFDIYFPRTLV